MEKLIVVGAVVVVVVRPPPAKGDVLLELITNAAVALHRLEEDVDELVVGRPVEAIAVAENGGDVEGKVELIGEAAQK